MFKKLPAYNVYLIYTGATSLFFSLVFTVSSIYYIERVGLNPLQLVLVGTVLETAYFVFEIPTGVVADVYSRRLSVIIGIIMIGIGFMLEGFIPLFIAVLTSQVLWGIGATFLSGSDDAWIADEIGEENLQRVFIRGTQISQVLALVGIILSVVLGSLYINMPIIIGGIMFLGLAAFLLLFMPENGFKPVSDEEKNSWQKLGHTFYLGLNFIKKQPVLITIIFISLLYGLYSEGIDRLWNAHFLNSFEFPKLFNFKPVIWFGIINSIAMIFSIVVVGIIEKKADKTGKLERVWVLVAINCLLVLSVIAFGLSGNFTAALMTFWTIKILRTANGPIYRAWINQNIESKVRATVVSTIGQFDALGQIIAGPFIGLIALRASISTAIIVAGIILAPVVLLYLQAIKIAKQEDI